MRPNVTFIIQMLLSLTLVLSSQVVSAGSLVLDPNQPQQKLSQKMLYFEDETGSLTIEQLLAADRNAFSWQLQESEVPNFGYNNNPFWIRIAIHNETPSAIERLFTIEYPLLDNINVYKVYQGSVDKQWELGDTRPFSEREVYNRNFIIPMVFPAGESIDLYLRIHTSSSLQVPLNLVEEAHFNRQEFQETVAQFIFYGGLIVMAVYNLFIYFSVRSISYLYYVGYVIAVSMLFLAVQGYGFQLIWPDLPTFNSNHITILSPLSLLTGIVFGNSFLETKKYSRKAYYYLLGLSVLLILTLILGALLPYRVMIKPALLISIATAISLLVTGIIVWKAGNQSARFFNLAWVTLLINVVMYDMNKLGLISRNVFTENGMQLGVMMEVVLLSFALADRINRDRREKYEAQKLAIHNENLAREEHERYLQATLKAEVDELKAKEETIRAQAESKAKSDFLAAMSHEIRTPMNGVIGMCEMLKQGKLDPQSRFYVDIIDSSGKALLTLINDILDYSKIEAGKMEIEKVDFDLTQLAEEVCSVFALQAQRKAINLRSNIESGTPLLLKGDPNRLRQILLNFIGNAFKFTHEGSISLNIFQVESDDGAINIRFEVQDSGIGISPEGKAKLFSDFSQAEQSTSRKYGGTGLGLSISKKLTDLMGGTIGVDSELNQGSCFWIVIPLQAASKDFVPNAKVERESDYINLENLSVLIAEDNTVNQLVIGSMMKKIGCRSHVVEDGEKALRYYKQYYKTIDVILMDCVMPVLDGYQATQAIREFEKDQGIKPVTIYALSAHAMDEHRNKSIESGMDDHLSKPLEFDLLCKKLEQISVSPKPPDAQVG